MLFDAGAFAMPGTAATVNSWVAEATKGLIKELITDDIVQDPLVQALLVMPCTHTNIPPLRLIVVPGHGLAGSLCFS